MFELLFVTSNNHKVQEVREILKDYNIKIYGLNDLGIELGEVVENGNTYEENALIKAKAAQKFTKMPLFADDSGFEVFALNHQPGIFSSRFEKSHGGNKLANEVILSDLKNKSDRSARFNCNIALLNILDTPLIFQGEVKGNVSLKQLGDDDFGYDPIFIPQGYSKTFGELGKEIKNKISHRSNALHAMLKYLKENNYLN